VARQLGDAALLQAGDLARLGDPDWDRTLIYTYPERAERSLRWLAVHTVHEVRHLADLRRQLPARPARTPGEREARWQLELACQGLRLAGAPNFQIRVWSRPGGIRGRWSDCGSQAQWIQSAF
jgi:hypothetical protein